MAVGLMQSGLFSKLAFQQAGMKVKPFKRNLLVYFSTTWKYLRKTVRKDWHGFSFVLCWVTGNAGVVILARSVALHNQTRTRGDGFKGNSSL